MRIDCTIVNSGRLRESPVNQSDWYEIRWLFIVDAGLTPEAFSLILFFYGARYIKSLPICKRLFDVKSFVKPDRMHIR